MNPPMHDAVRQSFQLITSEVMLYALRLKGEQVCTEVL